MPGNPPGSAVLFRPLPNVAWINEDLGGCSGRLDRKAQLRRSESNVSVVGWIFKSKVGIGKSVGQ